MRMTKGIAPILATVLIVLVVIALAGTFLLWSSRAFTTGTERGTAEIQRITTTAAEGIEILALDCVDPDQITIRNAGSVDLQTSQLTVFENETLRTVTWTAATLAPSAVTTSAWLNTTPTNTWTLDRGDVVRITTRQGIADSASCQ